MKRILGIVTFAAAASVLLSGCQHDDLGGIVGHSKKITPVVHSVSSTKATDERVSSDGKWIGSYTISDDPANPLFLHVYEKDIEDLPASAPATKGTTVTTGNITSFNMKAYAWSEWHDNTISSGQGSSLQPYSAGLYFDGVSVSRPNTSSSVWTMSEEKYWLNDVDLSFWSWNYVEPVVSTTNYYLASLSGYEVPTTVSNQKDIVFAYNEENRKFNNQGSITGGKDETVDIKFYHALSEIKFDVSGVADELYVSNITLNNIYSKGDCAIDIDETDTDDSSYFYWSSLNTPVSYSQDFAQYNDFVASGTNKGQMVDGSSKVFFLIPQSLAAAGTKNAVTMSVTFAQADGTGTEGPITKDIHLNGTETVKWKAGKYYTYRLSKTADDYDYTLSLTSYSHLFDNNATADKYTTFEVKSEKISKRTLEVKDDNYPWHIKSYRIGKYGTEIDVDGSSFDAGTAWVSSAVNLTDRFLSVKATKALKENRGSYSYWTGDNGLWSPAEWSGDAIDLSRMDYTKDVRSQAVNHHKMTTANCYVIRHAGTYKLPLVYGNAVMSGMENGQSYFPNTSGGSNRLVRFVNHRDEPINSPFIENHQGCEALSWAIIWQDNEGVISNLEVVGNPKTVDYTNEDSYYTIDDVRYLQFKVNQNKVCQNNAVICIYDDLYDDGTGSARTGYNNGQYDEGECIWSWHIWTFNDPILLEDPIDVTNYDGDLVYSFFPTYNMGVIETETYDEREDIYITLAQDSPSTNTVEVRISQLSYVPKSNGVTYNWGRKDPFPKDDSKLIVDSNGSVSLGESIRKPHTFFYSPTGAINWCNQTYYNLWTGKKSLYGDLKQDYDMIKTIYDPCPVKYKVPAGDAFSSFEILHSVPGSDNTKWNVVSTVSNSTGFVFYTSLKLSNSQSGGPQINDDGPTISFPFNGIRVGFSYAGTIPAQFKSTGWFYGAHFQDAEKPSIFFISTSSIEALNAAAAGNAHCVRPVIDPTVPVPTVGGTLGSDPWKKGGDGNIKL